jgi:hypothetical protein
MSCFINGLGIQKNVVVFMSILSGITLLICTVPLHICVLCVRYITAKTKNLCRLIGLSTALANAHDLADWLGIDAKPGKGLFNFRPSVRPVPMEVHLRGFPGQVCVHLCFICVHSFICPMLLV